MEAWKSAKPEAEQKLFERVSQTCATVARILRIAETVSGLLENNEPGYEESVADAREHFNALLSPGWLLTGSLRERLVHWQGLEMRLTRMFGAAPVKDLQKLERYEEKASEIWQREAPCQCGQCPAAIAREAWLEEDFALRLHTFAPEIKARMK